MKGVSSDHFPKTCNPDDYDLTVIFSELIYLADSSIPINQDIIGSEARIQKKSDENTLYQNYNNQYYFQAQERNDLTSRSDYIKYVYSLCKHRECEYC